ncbi:MAG: CBS domain-containing protein [Alphaproteobacteria bacterium]|nr:CBS domain-containing protein [Alphaproteobacteria bacterium]
MLVSQILKAKGSQVVTIERHRSIRDAAELMTTHGIGAVLVRDAGGTCGIVSERDIARAVATEGESAARAAVETTMTTDIVTCAPTDKSDELMTLMTHRRIRHLPVMSGGELVGMVSIGDIVKARLTELETDSEALKTYIAGSI